MKSILLNIVFLLTVHVSLGQINPVVSSTNLNVLYRGIDNPLSIAVPEWSCSNVVVTATNADFSGSDCSYVINPKEEHVCILTFKGVMNSDTTILGVSKFRIKEIPAPDPYFAGFTGDNNTIQKNTLLAAQGVIARMIDFDFHLTVLSFRVRVNTTDCVEFEFQSNSNRVTEQMNSKFEELGSGDQVKIHDIVAKGPNGNTWNLTSIELVLK